MTSQLFESGLAAMTFARNLTLSLLDAIPQSDWTHMPVPGGNHALWIAGHIAWTDEYFLGNFSSRRENKLPPSWHEACGQGSKPVTDLKSYPSIDETKTQMAAMRAEMIGMFSSKSDKQLLEPLPEEWRSFAPNLAALMGTIGCHECMHAGQLTAIRKSLQLDPVFG
ncbi:MAG: DinB family protein [Planctomycetota bacterium]|jgi:hypothetical protein